MKSNARLIEKLNAQDTKSNARDNYVVGALEIVLCTRNMNPKHTALRGLAFLRVKNRFCTHCTTVFLFPVILKQQLLIFFFIFHNRIRHLLEAASVTYFDTVPLKISTNFIINGSTSRSLHFNC